MEVCETIGSQGTGTFGRRDRRRHHSVSEGSETVVELKFVNPSNDLASETRLSAWEWGYILAGKSLGDG